MPPEDSPIVDSEADTEVLDDEPKSILLSLISQLRKGMDLHRVTLPTFILEPRSMLERITDFMAHPDILTGIPKQPAAESRFIAVLKYYLSGWHIRPKGVKKPYNPVLGEFFRCRWKFPNDTEAFYVAEQVSHHPPISAFYYYSPVNGVSVEGELRPKSKFLGNSAATIMCGGSKIRLDAFPKEEYEVSNPNVYARGLLFGTMLLELGDTAVLKCAATDLMCEMEFTTKGYFTGTYNGLKGRVKRISSGEVLYNLSGKWTDTIYIQGNARGATQEILFDVLKSNIHPKMVAPEDEQEEYESRKLWHKLTKAMLSRNMDLATDEKTQVEDRQRKIRSENEQNGHTHQSRFFFCENDVWKFVHDSDLRRMDPQEAGKKLEQIIFSNSK